MAIQVQYTFKGFSVPAAYVEVSNVSLHKPIPANQIGYYVWKDASKQELLEQETESVDYDPEMNVPSAYAHIKSLPKFAGAIDILEEGQQV